MNREEIYNKWLDKEHAGIEYCGKSTIKQWDKISDNNFMYYVEYQRYLVESGVNQESLKQRRSKILNFLTSKEINCCNLEELTQDIVETYFTSMLENSKSDATYNSIVNFVKGFLDFCSKKFDLQLNWDGMRIKKKDLKTSQEYVKNALTAEQISLCKEKYKDDLRKSFLFQIFYYTDLTKDEVKNLRIENIEFCSIKIDGREPIVIPESLQELIILMNKKGLLNQSYDVNYYIEQMKDELKSFGIKNFKRKDLDDSREKLYWRCPQCGHSFEAIADNWCVCQYTENGEYWIVCRENCGNV